MCMLCICYAFGYAHWILVYQGYQRLNVSLTLLLEVFVKRGGHFV